MKKLILLVLCVLYFGHVAGQVIELSQPQKSKLLAMHNFYRRQAGSPELVWSGQLERQARQWLHAFKERPLIPRNTLSYEQNMSLLSDSSHISKAVEQWAREQIYYNGDFSDSAKMYLYQHYFRMINPEFDRIGCALLERTEGVYVLVCFYSH